MVNEMMKGSVFVGSEKRRNSVTPYLDPTGNIAAARVDREREEAELRIVAGMAVQSILSRHSTNAQLADMMRGMSRWWGKTPKGGLSRYAWSVSHHAAERAVEMGMTEYDVYALLVDPEVKRIQGSRSAYAGDYLYLRGDYAAAVAKDTWPKRVVTFLYRYQDDYEAQYAAPSEGREYRAHSHLPRKHAS